jgi:hypothetical protein
MMLFDRSQRSLANLKENASSSRALNLLAIWKEHGTTPEHQERPFFRSSVLNRCIIVKHRLRRDETDYFARAKHVATKVILPLDPHDLKIGGFAFFVGQLGYGPLLREMLPQGGPEVDHDERLLTLLDALPSLDPFLMRERLREVGYEPAPCYFDLSEGDARRMYGFLRRELEPLIASAIGPAQDVLDEKTAKLANKILSDAGDEELEPLRLVLGMKSHEFAEGVFCWKGYVYYKWRMSELLPQVRPVAQSIANIRTFNSASREGSLYIAASRRNLKRIITEHCRSTHEAMKVYDDAFIDLTRRGQPKAFREFLMRSPQIFQALGERLGALEHIVSFWRYRFPDGEPPAVGTEELRDIFMDFEAGLAASMQAPREWQFLAA